MENLVKIWWCFGNGIDQAFFVIGYLTHILIRHLQKRIISNCINDILNGFTYGLHVQSLQE